MKADTSPFRIAGGSVAGKLNISTFQDADLQLGRVAIDLAGIEGTVPFTVPPSIKVFHPYVTCEILDRNICFRKIWLWTPKNVHCRGRRIR